MALRENQLNLQGLLRFAIQHTTSEDPTTESQYKEMDPERKEFLDAAMKHMTVDVIEEFKKAMETLDSATATKDDKLQALNVIRDYVDNLDFANNFIKVGGSEILLKYLKAKESELRVAAIYVVAEISQNNPFAQKHFVDAQVIPLLTSYFTENQEIASSSIHAVSSLVRNYPPGLVEFLKLSGVRALLKCLNTVQTRCFVKACFLIACLSTENPDVRDEFVTKSAIPALWEYVEEPGDGFDIRIETVLYAISELSESPKWKPDAVIRAKMQGLLGEIIDKNKELPQSEETVAYSRRILENLKKV